MPINIPRGFAISAPGAGRLRRAIGSIQADRVPLLDVAKGLGQLGPTLTGIGVQGMEQERKDAERAAVVELEEEHLLAEEELEAESEGRERTEEDARQAIKSPGHIDDENRLNLTILPLFEIIYGSNLTRGAGSSI